MPPAMIRRIGKTSCIAQRKARAAVALLRLGEPEKVWPLFKQARDGRVRSYLIHWSGPLGVDRQTVIRHWRKRPTLANAARCCSCSANSPTARWPAEQRQRLVEQLLAIFEEEPDPGLHAAAEWLLRKWKCDDRLRAAIERLKKERRPAARRPAGARKPDQRQWYVNRQGQTFVIVDARQPFTMGSPPGEPDAEDNETRHERKIGRRYAIAASCRDQGTVRAFSGRSSTRGKDAGRKEDIEKFEPTILHKRA